MAMVLTATAPTDSSPALPAGVIFPADALARVTHWVRQKPNAPALLHKQHGRWGAWCWSDVAQAIAQRRDALAQQGLGTQARLALSGALEPQLVLLALAAHGAGATVIAIDRHAQGVALRELLHAAKPTHAFVQDRKTISAWIGSGHANAALVPLYSAQPVAHDSGSWHIVPLTNLLGTAPKPTATGKHSSLHQHPILWVDEGTEWAGGLEQTLAAWLEHGATLAAPEVSAAATRDRHEIQPQRILASAARQQQLQAQLRTRLASPGSWQRRLSDHAARQPDGLLSAWLLRRITRLHGLPAQPKAHGTTTKATA